MVRYEKSYRAEIPFVELASEIPGFAGYSYIAGSNQLVVSLADLSAEQSAREIVDRNFSQPEMIGYYGRARVSIKRVRYSYLDLAEWRDRIDSLVTDMSGVRTLDLDEARNRLTVGITDPQIEERLRANFRQFSIPDDSYVIVQSTTTDCTFYPTCGESISLVNSSDPYAQTGVALNLRSKFDTIQAGIVMSFFDNDAVEEFCTIGFAGRSEINANNANPSILTASHCSRNRGQMQSDAFYQPAKHWQGSTLTSFATELYDPPFEPCDTTTCRWSDALIANSNRPVASRIARPYGPPLAPNPVDSASSLYIDPSAPYFPITAIGSLVADERVDKVGAKTGWSQGVLGITCQIHYYQTYGTPHRRRYECQSLATYYSDGGDSGGPVFRFNSSAGTAVLLGVTWGRDMLSTGEFDDSVFSQNASVQSDLGGYSLW